eukprot:Gb_39621 [translate_table: standard]
MTKASIKGKYEVGVHATTTTFVVDLGDLNLKVTCINATFSNGLRLDGNLPGVEKLGFFKCNENLFNDIVTLSSVLPVDCSSCPLRVVGRVCFMEDAESGLQPFKQALVANLVNTTRSSSRSKDAKRFENVEGKISELVEQRMNCSGELPLTMLLDDEKLVALGDLNGCYYCKQARHGRGKCPKLLKKNPRLDSDNFPSLKANPVFDSNRILEQPTLNLVDSPVETIGGAWRLSSSHEQGKGD